MYCFICHLTGHASNLKSDHQESEVKEKKIAKREKGSSSRHWHEWVQKSLQ